MVKIANIEFAPLSIPFHRRLQTVAVLHYMYTFLFSIFLLPFIYIVLFPFIWPLALIYGLWLVYDFGRSTKGARLSMRLRKWSLYRYLAAFFPITLVKTADLDPDRNYIFGYHPHGITSVGAFTNFATEGTGFSEKFPGIRSYLCTLSMNYYIPLRREYVLFLGIVDAGKESIAYLLTKMGKGVSVTLVIGGAAEALDAHPGKYVLTLRHRKGFVRMAMKYGADLVPVFSFGENDLFLQSPNPEGSRIREFQDKVKKLCGFSPPLFYGRGIFNYNFGLLPFRKAVHTVVGAPIHVQQCDEFTSEMVDNVHNQYMDALSELFDKHKRNYGIPDEIKLTFV